MTPIISGLLLVLALLDGSFAGFRSSVGRTGLIDHRSSDHQAALRGMGLVCVLLAPVIVLASTDVAIGHDRLAAYARGGTGMLVVYVPYALLVLIALAVYVFLGWRQKYLASALILGPFTLLRPGIALLGAALAAMLGRDVMVAACVGLSVVAVLAVEPLADRLWYA